MLVRKTREQKKYLLKLKSEVSDFLINYKKRYQLFPWSQVNKISKLQINSNSPINVNGIDFTVKKLVNEINKTKSKIQSRMRPSYYNYILKAYIKDSMNKDGKQLKDVYNQYNEELQNVFKEMRMDLLFCLEGLKQMNRALKPDNKKKHEKKILTESFLGFKKDKDKNDTKDINITEFTSICKKIVNTSYTYVKKFISDPEVKKKYKDLYDEMEVCSEDITKDIESYAIDCGISQHACITSNIFDDLLDGLEKYLDEELDFKSIKKDYDIFWDDKNSGYIWLATDCNKAVTDVFRQYTESTDIDHNQKILDELKHYVKWCIMDDIKFSSIRPLDNYMIHQSKKDGELLLLATCTFGDMSKENIDDIKSCLKNNIWYNGKRVDFHTCYLPGDIFLYIKLDDTVEEATNTDYDDRENVLLKALKILKDNGRNPNIMPKEQEKWLKCEQTSSFGDKLCIANLGNEGLQTLCTKVNAIINSYGGKLSPDNYGTAFLSIHESTNLFEESVILNKSDLYYNVDKFEKGDTNVLLITGFSGSGKSTLASQLSNKYKCDYLELDALDFFFGGNLTKEEMEKGEPGLLAFLNKHKELKPKDIPGNDEYNKIYSEYIQFLINWCKKQQDKKFIIEGLQIYETFDEKDPQPYIRSNALIIKGTSGLVSAIRASKRNSKDNKETSFFKELNSLVKWVIKDEKYLTYLYKYVKESEDIDMFDNDYVYNSTYTENFIDTIKKKLEYNKKLEKFRYSKLSDIQNKFDEKDIQVLTELKSECDKYKSKIINALKKAYNDFSDDHKIKKVITFSTDENAFVTSNSIKSNDKNKKIKYVYNYHIMDYDLWKGEYPARSPEASILFQKIYEVLLESVKKIDNRFYLDLDGDWDDGGINIAINKTISFKEYKESEDIDMFDITEKEQKDIKYFLSECYLEMLEDEIIENNDDVLTEGANLDARQILKKFKKIYKEEMAEIKTNLKESKYDESKKGCENLLALLKDAKKELLALESTVGSVIWGFFTAWTINFLRNFALGLIPYFGSIIASIQDIIEGWGKPIKKIINSEEVEMDDFNKYKNVIESRFEKMEKVIKDTIKKIDSLKKEYPDTKSTDEKEVKETTEFEENMTLKFVDESGDLVDIRDIALEIREASEMEDFEDDEVTTEGANFKARRSYKDMKKKVKELSKKYKKAMKVMKYDEAKVALNEIKKIISEAEKDIKSVESTGASIIFGSMAEALLSITRNIYILIPIAGPFVVLFKNAKYGLDKLGKLFDNIKKSDNVTADEFNDYKNYLLVHISTLKEDIKKLEKVLNEEEKLAKKAEIEKAKLGREIKESAEFKAEKLSIYEACNRGEITVEEREELFQNLKDKFYLSEAATDDETITEESGLSNKEKFEKVRSVLYERCGRGEITIEERESLVLKAKDMIFSESNEIDKNTKPEKTDVSSDDKDSKEMEKEIEKAMK